MQCVSSSQRERTGRQTGWAVLIAIVGVLLATVHVSHLLSGSDNLRQTIRITIPLGLSLGIIGGAVWLRSEAYDDGEFRLVISWIVAAIAAMVGLTFSMGLDIAYPGGFDSNPVFVFANTSTAGAVFGLILGVYDVRRRQHATQLSAARESSERARARFETLFENVPSPTILYEYNDCDPITLSVNSAFESVFGYDESDVIGDPIDKHIVPPELEDEASMLNERLRSQDLQVEVRRQTADGPRDFILYTVPIKSSNERGFATYVDISDQKRREQRLEVLNRVLRHDLRNAMNVVMGHTQRLLDEDSNNDSLHAIQNRAAAVQTLCDKARSVDQLAERQTTEEPIDICALVTEHTQRVVETSASVGMSTDIPDEEVIVHGGELLGVAFDNLFENSVSYGGENPSITVTVTVESDVVRIVVRDDGPGIPRHELEVLQNGRETPLEHGSGLGLWLVTWIVEDAGGAVEFVTDDSGTTTTITLPLFDRETDLTERPENASDSTGPSAETIGDQSTIGGNQSSAIDSPPPSNDDDSTSDENASVSSGTASGSIDP